MILNTEGEPIIDLNILIIFTNSLTLWQDAQNGPHVFEPFSQQAGYPPKQIPIARTLVAARISAKKANKRSFTAGIVVIVKIVGLPETNHNMSQ